MTKHAPEMREEARRLRRAGTSFKEVARQMGISSATSWIWCRDIQLSATQRKTLRGLGAKQAHARWREIGAGRRERWRAEAQKMWQQHHTDPLFLLGLGLYWGEGTKAKALEMTNADPGLVRVWLLWCQRFTPTRQLRFWVQAHADVCESQATGFWRQELGLRPSTVIGFSTARSRASKKIYKESRRLPYGTIRVTMRRGAAEWVFKMTVFIELMSQFASAEFRLQPDT